MIIYNLTEIKHYLHPKVFKIELDEKTTANVFVSNSLYHFLTKSKKRIDDNVFEWDQYKKYTNPYEFIHTPISQNGLSVANYTAISRSFYKMVEISNFYHLFENFQHRSLRSFHLAEGPGGFIEAMMFMRKNNFDEHTGMTLLTDNKNVPKWNKLQNKFRFNSRIKYELGETENGDLLAPENIEYCFFKYRNSMDLLTGDGGFDFSLDYEKQEAASTKLLFAQAMYAILMQKREGNFVLKIFDIFRKPTVELIYILSCFYHSVSICKPKTSRFANSEKYIVCKNFKVVDSSPYFLIFKKALMDFRNEEANLLSVLSFELPIHFIKEIEELNCILGKKQLNTIHGTLMMIQEKQTMKIDKMVKTNIEKCVHWCVTNHIPYQSTRKQGNIFTNSKVNKKVLLF